MSPGATENRCYLLHSCSGTAPFYLGLHCHRYTCFYRSKRQGCRQRYYFSLSVSGRELTFFDFRQHTGTHRIPERFNRTTAGAKFPDNVDLYCSADVSCIRYLVTGGVFHPRTKPTATSHCNVPVYQVDSGFIVCEYQTVL